MKLTFLLGDSVACRNSTPLPVRVFSRNTFIIFVATKKSLFLEGKWVMASGVPTLSCDKLDISSRNVVSFGQGHSGAQMFL